MDNLDMYFDVTGVIGNPVTPVPAERSFTVDFENVLTFHNDTHIKMPSNGPQRQQEDG